MRASLTFALLLVLLATACSTRTHNLASSPDEDASADAGDPSDDAGASDADVSDADAFEGGFPLPTYDGGVVYCGARACACSNGEDDDGDGIVDGDDPECTGAFDDDERTFATGVPDEQRAPKCQDCYFDRVPGRDVCNRASSCPLTGTPGNGNGQCSTCAVQASCRDQCAPLAPNGCDCFGCCEVWRDGERFEIMLEASCSIEALGDPTRCTSCIRAADCVNPCETCELCPGRALRDLPPECIGYTCAGSDPCRRSSDCGGAEYCQFGCCLAIAI